MLIYPKWLIAQHTGDGDGEGSGDGEGDGKGGGGGGGSGDGDGDKGGQTFEQLKIEAGRKADKIVELQKKIDDRAAADKQASDDKLEADGKLQELIDKYKVELEDLRGFKTTTEAAEAKRVEGVEKAVEKKLESVEDADVLRNGLLSGLTPDKQLEVLTAFAGGEGSEAKPIPGIGVKKGGNAQTITADTLTPDQVKTAKMMGVTPAQYAQDLAAKLAAGPGNAYKPDLSEGDDEGGE